MHVQVAIRLGEGPLQPLPLLAVIPEGQSHGHMECFDAIQAKEEKGGKPLSVP